MIPDKPPADADSWTDEQWIEWLEGTERAEIHEISHPATLMGRITHSSAGSVLGQAMLGMATALYGQQPNNIVVVADASSQPDEDRPFSVHLDREHPERSVVVVRDLRPRRPGR